MKSALFIIFLSTLSTGTLRAQTEGPWIRESKEFYTISYTPVDTPYVRAYEADIDSGIRAVEEFFHHAYPKIFSIYIFPERRELDSALSADWKVPGFKSECWMVASGVASKIDMLSPFQWDKQACEHVYAHTLETRRLIAHELVHVFHGQFNPSPDYSDLDRLDWFVEGLATYASGQCSASRLAEVRKQIESQTLPLSLDDFWTGKTKYGLSGSVVMYLDQAYGRTKLTELLTYNKKQQVLDALGTSEVKLVEEWKKFILSQSK